jgi:hypothetical protein
MAALAEAICGLMRYVCAFHRLLTGKRKASTTTMATIMAAPWCLAPARTARARPRRPVPQLGNPAASSESIAAWIRASAAIAATKRIGITVAL